MRKIRVLVVDDSTVARRLLAEALSSCPDLDVIGFAANGRIALAKIPQINPDIVTLNIEMPELDGLGTLKELRRTYPVLPVIMFSALTRKGAQATVDALALGASDYVTKPSNVGSIEAAVEQVREELIPKIKSLCDWEPGPRASRARAADARGAARSGTSAAPTNKVEIICIGVSTGGPNALDTIFRQLPADLAVPIVIVQHMPPVFTGYLADRLAAVSSLNVHEAKAGEILQPGGAWVAPGDFHLALVRTGATVTTVLDHGPPENSCRPAADVLFRSVSEIYGSAALAVVLTGMGRDGLRGCESIRAAGGRVVTQDQASSVVWGMPRAVVRAGLANEVLPIDKIADRLTNLVSRRPPYRPFTPALARSD